jgi:hypothetical protein
VVAFVGAVVLLWYRNDDDVEVMAEYKRGTDSVLVSTWAYV